MEVTHSVAQRSPSPAPGASLPACSASLTPLEPQARSASHCLPHLCLMVHNAAGAGCGSSVQ